MIRLSNESAFFKDGILFVAVEPEPSSCSEFVDFDAGKACFACHDPLLCGHEDNPAFYTKPILKSGDHVVIAEPWANVLALARLVSKCRELKQLANWAMKIQPFSTMPSELFSECPQYKITGDCLGVKETFSPRAIDEAINNKFGPTVNKTHYFKYPATEVEG